MGKGDRKTKRGKINKGTFGKFRSSKKNKKNKIYILNKKCIISPSWI
jgi:ribosomal small subunit protein bTHX